jgi:hypothetical protein
MATTFPVTVDILSNPTPTSSLNAPSHSAQHTNANDAIEAVEGYLLSPFVVLADGTLALAMGSSTNVNVRVTPNATASFTTSVPAAGMRRTLLILTSGVTSYTMTFGSGFRSQGTLATGTTTARYFALEFISDGTNLIELGRTTAMA